jgi:LuxR family transcriptional regulator, maltose regulon positive regulatory protein
MELAGEGKSSFSRSLLQMNPSPSPLLMRVQAVLEIVKARVDTPVIVLVAENASFRAAVLRGLEEWFIKNNSISSARLDLIPEDNQVPRLLARLENVGQRLGIEPESEPLSSADAFYLLEAWLNRLGAAPLPSFLFLEDYSILVNPLVHELLAYLVDYLPPNAHLLISASAPPALPLARWRVRRWVWEIIESSPRPERAEE